MHNECPCPPSPLTGSQQISPNRAKNGVEFNIWKFDREWGNILQLDQILENCSHDHICEYKDKIPKLLSQSREEITRENASSGSTNVYIQGDVGTVGSLGGQNNNNKS